MNIFLRRCEFYRRRSQLNIRGLLNVRLGAQNKVRGYLESVCCSVTDNNPHTHVMDTNVSPLLSRAEQLTQVRVRDLLKHRTAKEDPVSSHKMYHSF